MRHGTLLLCVFDIMLILFQVGAILQLTAADDPQVKAIRDKLLAVLAEYQRKLPGVVKRVPEDAMAGIGKERDCGSLLVVLDPFTLIKTYNIICCANDLTDTITKWRASYVQTQMWIDRIGSW